MAAAAAILAGHARVDQRELHVLLRAGAREQVEILEHEAERLVPDLRERRLRQPRDLRAIQLVDARRGTIQAPEDVHERGLARPGRAHDRDELTASDAERDAPERMHSDVARRIHLLDVRELDERTLARRRCPCGVSHGTTMGCFLDQNSRFTVVAPAALGVPPS